MLALLTAALLAPSAASNTPFRFQRNFIWVDVRVENMDPLRFFALLGKEKQEVNTMLIFAVFSGLLTLAAPLAIDAVVSTGLLGRGAVRTSIAESHLKFDMVSWLEEIASLPFAFKGPGGYEKAYERTEQLAAGYLECRRNHFRILLRQIIGSFVLSTLANGSLLVIGGWLVISQQITLGQFVASELIFSSILASLTKVGKKLESWYSAMAAMEKLGSIIDLETERENGDPASPPAKASRCRPHPCSSASAVNPYSTTSSTSRSLPAVAPRSPAHTAPAPAHSSDSSARPGGSEAPAWPGWRTSTRRGRPPPARE